MRLIWTIVAFSAASLGFLWLTDIPLGVPTDDFGTWNRHAYSAPAAATSLLINVCVALIVAAGYISIAWIGLRKIDSCGIGGLVIRLLLLVAVGFFWLSAVQRCTPVTYAAVKPNWVLYDSGSAGYFLETIKSEDSTAEFLAGYEAELEKGDVLHVGTHPPGLFLVNRFLIWCCESSDILTGLLLDTIPSDMDDAFRTVEEGARLAAPLKEHQRAALWLSVLMTQFFAAAAVVMVYWLIRSAEVVRILKELQLPNGQIVAIEEDVPSSKSVAWMAATLWPLVPSLAVFIPKSDAVFPCLFTAILPLWFCALHRKSFLLAGLTGALICFNALLSLAVLPTVVVLVLATLMLFRFQWKDLYQRFSLSCLIPLVLGFGLCCLAFWILTGVDLANVWTMNLRNHAGFYDQFHRTTWKWMLINPLELSLSVGMPIAILAIVALVRSRRVIAIRWKVGAIRPVLFQAAIATGLLLWLSGKNSGEAARLWLFLMPWVLWVASGAFIADPNGRISKPLEKQWRWIMLIQAVVAIGTVSRVAGFHFGP